MRTLVTGGREFHNRAFLFSTLDKVHAETPISILISGGAVGADAMAEEWAELRGVHVAKVRPYWRKRDGTTDYGAGHRRNRAMLHLLPELVVAFPGDRGTAGMVNAALEAKVPVFQPPIT